jgi:hypothetical protein
VAGLWNIFDLRRVRFDLVVRQSAIIAWQF